MTKSEMIGLLSDGTHNIRRVADVLGVTRQTVYRWKDPLPQSLIDQVRGAHIRLVEEKDAQAVAIFGRK